MSLDPKSGKRVNAFHFLIWRLYRNSQIIKYSGFGGKRDEIQISGCGGKEAAKIVKINCQNLLPCPQLYVSSHIGEEKATRVVSASHESLLLVFS